MKVADTYQEKNTGNTKVKSICFRCQCGVSQVPRESAAALGNTKSGSRAKLFPFAKRLCSRHVALVKPFKDRSWHSLFYRKVSTFSCAFSAFFFCEMWKAVFRSMWISVQVFHLVHCSSCPRVCWMTRRTFVWEQILFKAWPWMLQNNMGVFDELILVDRNRSDSFFALLQCNFVRTKLWRTAQPVLSVSRRLHWKFTFWGLRLLFMKHNNLAGCEEHWQIYFPVLFFLCCCHHLCAEMKAPTFSVQDGFSLAIQCRTQTVFHDGWFKLDGPHS